MQPADALWFRIGLASHKGTISLYACAASKEGYVAEKHKAELGKVSVGKSCIRFKSFDDVNHAALKKVLKLAAKGTFGM